MPSGQQLRGHLPLASAIKAANGGVLAAVVPCNAHSFAAFPARPVSLCGLMREARGAYTGILSPGHKCPVNQTEPGGRFGLLVFVLTSEHTEAILKSSPLQYWGCFWQFEYCSGLLV